jgi:hypothetical protein
LWDLKARACPECGRAFTLDEWDFENSDALFACRACGERLVGTTPRELPGACPACGGAVERRLVVVRRGVTGRDAPCHTRDGLRGLARACTVTMVLGTLAMFASLFHFAGSTSRHAKPDVVLAIIAAYAIGAGAFGVWPARLGRRVGLLVAIFFLVVLAFIGSHAIQAHNRTLKLMPMHQSRCLRNVAQSMVISMHQTGTLPADPQGLVDARYLPADSFYPRTNPPGHPTTATPLPNGWLTVGEMHVDWTPAAWNWNTPVVAMVYEHSLRRDGLLMARSNGGTRWVAWPDVPAAVAQANADRAAIGLPPIPPAALPPP